MIHCAVSKEGAGGEIRDGEITTSDIVKWLSLVPIIRILKIE
jgi:hypothetical protein